MQRRNIIIVLLAIAVMTSVFFYLKSQAVKIDPEINESKLNNEEVLNNKKIGDLNFQYNLNYDLVVDREDYINIKIPVNLNYLPFYFYLTKNSNPQKLEIAKWFSENNPEEDRQSIYSIVNQENIFLDKKEAYKVQYYAHPQLTGGYYDLVSIYIAHGADIYEINYYTKPTLAPEDTIVLNQNDLENLQSYTKNVEKIIQSIHFSD